MTSLLKRSSLRPSRSFMTLGSGCLRAALTVLGIAFTLPLQAEMPGADKGRIRAADRWTREEVQMLPQYCHARMFANTTEKEAYWTHILGPAYQHIHHYCRGLVHTNRGVLLFRDPVEKKRALNFSIGEFDYILRHVGKDFVLLPEILTKRGDNLIRLGRAPEGTQNLRDAIEIKPDYWPPYGVMSDYYRYVGDKAKAREWLEKALAIAPDAKPLKDRIARIDGMSGKPAQRTEPAPTQEAAATAQSAASGDPSERTK